jgi:membrane-associated phospholipid phosphatase
MVRSSSAVPRLFFGVLLPLLIVGVLAEEVFVGARYASEVPLLLKLHAQSSEGLNRLATVFTDLGGVAVIAPASALLLAYFCQRRRACALFFAVSVGGSAALTLIMKWALPRHRPALWPRLVAENDASFPSGHALYSLALVLALLLIFWRAPTFARWRWPALLVGLLFSLMVGWSRLYLGVHYPSDVLAGWLSALAWVTGVYGLLRGGLRGNIRADQVKAGAVSGVPNEAP